MEKGNYKITKNIYMCPPATRQKNNTHKQKPFFFEVASDQESFIKNIHMHTPEQLIHERHDQHEQYEHVPPPLRRNRIGHQLSYELLLRYQLFVERRNHQETQETLVQERENHQEELAQERENHQEELAQQVEFFREIRQIERQLRSSDTPVNIREQLRRRHEELCALLNISDTN